MNKCDVCGYRFKYQDDYIYKEPEMIYFCLECAKKHITDEQAFDISQWFRISAHSKSPNLK